VIETKYCTAVGMVENECPGAAPITLYCEPLAEPPISCIAPDHTPEKYSGPIWCCTRSTP